MEKALILQNKHWNKEVYPNLINRTLLPYVLNKLKLKEIQILLGVRRSGKSSIFKLLINHIAGIMDPLSIAYINLDDPFYSDVWKNAKELYRVVETAAKITGSKISYLFLDEIQNVHGWEKFIKSQYDAGSFSKIFITGSNSSLLKGNYARLLSGRYITDYVHPFSFQEILKNNGIESLVDILSNKPKVLSLLDNVLLYGSFPEVYKTPDPELKRDILLSYYETIILKDCLCNNGIRDTRAFRELAFYLMSNVSALYSYNGLAKAVTSNENTVSEFIGYLVESFLVNEVKNFSYSLKTQSKARKKIYSVDNSFLNTISFKFSDNKGKLLENLVYTELVKNGFREIFFFNENKECDFIVKTDKILTAIQVGYEIGQSNLDRETGGLITAMKKLNIEKGYIITYDTEEKISPDISMIPFWKLYQDFLK